MAAVSVQNRAGLSPFERGSKPFLVRLPYREMLPLSILSKRAQQLVSEVRVSHTQSLLQCHQVQLQGSERDKARLQIGRLEVSETLYHVIDLSASPLTAEQGRIFFPSGVPFPLFPQLHELSLSLSDGEEYSPDLYSLIAYHCPRLQFLKIGPIDNRVSMLVSRLFLLRRLDLHRPDLERASSLVAAVSLSRKLREVSISRPQRMTDEMLVELSALPLARLDIRYTELSGRAFRDFKSRGSLTELSLTSAKT